MLAVFYSLHFARAFLIPIAFALLLDFLLSPLVRVNEQGPYSNSAGAALVTIGLICAVAFTSYSFAGPAQKFLEDAPAGIAKARQEINKFVVPFERVGQKAVTAVAGIMVAGALWALGMPNPLLWGVLTVALEFIPYIGPTLMLIILTIAAMGTFDTLGQILLVPAAYFVANLIQGNIVTTMVLGRRLALNSVALFIGLAFWFWIWGIPGAFIGVPLMAVLKICCDHIESLAAVGEFLGARNEPTRAAAVPDAATM